MRLTRPSKETWRRVRRTAAQAAIASLGSGLVLAILRHDPMALAESISAGTTVVLVAGLHNWAQDQPAVPDNRTPDPGGE